MHLLFSDYKPYPATPLPLNAGKTTPLTPPDAGDWQIVVLVTSVQSLIGRLIAEFMIREGPYPFPTAIFDPRQIGIALTNRGVRLAALGYMGHMWELFALYAWILIFFIDMFKVHGVGTVTTVAFLTFLYPL